MPIKISFDMANTPESPTLVLAYRDGRKIGKIVAENVIVRDSMINPAEISFRVRKFFDGVKNPLWDKIVDFKLVWYKESDLWFEISVETNESDEAIKEVSCTQLGQAELSQIKLFNIEINTEDDIARDDYLIPTVLYNPDHPEASLLHRLMEKAPHYSILHVDYTIRNIQRTFTFDDISIVDAFQEIADEVGCLFVYHSDSDEDGKLRRVISVYDLESNCSECGHRGEFTSVCPECGSSNINEGYGEDTTIFVSSDELGNDIQFTSDTGSIKNCFKLEAGDDLMTATIRNCNPNGTDYIWHITDDTKADMSAELVEKIESYDSLYQMYQNDYIVNIDSSMLQQYNNLVSKYQNYNEDLQTIASPIKGYPFLMTAVYNTIDLSLYLESGLMPTVSMSDTNAADQAALLTTKNISPVAVTDVSNISLATANSVVLSMAKVVVDSRYRVKVNNSSLTSQTWTGNFVVTNYSDEDDTAISSTISVVISDDYEGFVKQKLDKTVKDKDEDNLSITGLFKLDYNNFCLELKKYCLNSLNSFHDACQACIDILIEQGVADSATWAGSEENLYDNLYVPYYQKLKAIESEIKIRQSEIDLVAGVYDADGFLIQNGLQPYLEDARTEIQNQLNFQNYIGDNLWLEFCTHRREDKYSNANYISDGLTNAELFENALEFIKVAKNEIYKSAELQHSISSSLKNLLVIKKFQPLVKYFNTGNWIRVLVDDKVYKLRLLEYEIDFENIDSLSVEFSDVQKTANGEVDQKSIMSKLASMSSSYDAVQKQASQGSDSNKLIKQWTEAGLDTTNTKIIGGASNQTQVWDEHGMLFREYNPVTDSYNDEQLKIVNSTIAITDDNWETVKTAVGAYYYFDPKTGKLTKAYGVNAEVLVGKVILGEQLGIYNESGSLSFDTDGFLISNGANSFRVNPNSNVLLAISNNEEDVFWIDENGKLHIVGDGAGIDVSANSKISDLESRLTTAEGNIKTEVTDRTNADAALSSSITQTANQIRSEVSESNGDLQSQITQNANSISTEVKDRENADNALSSSITQTAKDIRSEVSEADKNLQSQITQNATSITTEVTDRQNADTALSTKITQTASEIRSEVQSADNGLQSQITQNATSISTEITDRQNADNALSSSITQTASEIRSEVSEADKNLQSQITQNSDNITVEVTNRQNADKELDSKISVNADNITAEVTNRQNADNALQTQITVNANSITSKVSKGDIISTINQSAEEVTINASKISLEGLTTINSNFVVNTDGSIKAKNADISGKITASSGEIGGWTIGTNSLYAGSSGSHVELSTGDSTYAIWAGATSATDAPFRVAKDGTVYLTKLYVTDEEGNAQSDPVNLRTSYWQMDVAYNRAKRSVKEMKVDETTNTLQITLYDETTINFSKAAANITTTVGGSGTDFAVSVKNNGTIVQIKSFTGVLTSNGANSYTSVRCDGVDYGIVNVGSVYQDGYADGAPVSLEEQDYADGYFSVNVNRADGTTSGSFTLSGQSAYEDGYANAKSDYYDSRYNAGYSDGETAGKTSERSTCYKNLALVTAGSFARVSGTYTYEYTGGYIGFTDGAGTVQKKALSIAKCDATDVYNEGNTAGYSSGYSTGKADGKTAYNPTAITISSGPTYDSSTNTYSFSVKATNNNGYTTLLTETKSFVAEDAYNAGYDAGYAAATQDVKWGANGQDTGSLYAVFGNGTKTYLGEVTAEAGLTISATTATAYAHARAAGMRLAYATTSKDID